jgi:hypothetical protein
MSSASSSASATGSRAPARNARSRSAHQLLVVGGAVRARVHARELDRHVHEDAAVERVGGDELVEHIEDGTQLRGWIVAGHAAQPLGEDLPPPLIACLKDGEDQVFLALERTSVRTY